METTSLVRRVGTMTWQFKIHAHSFSSSLIIQPLLSRPGWNKNVVAMFFIATCIHINTSNTYRVQNNQQKQEKIVVTFSCHGMILCVYIKRAYIDSGFIDFFQL